MRAARRWWWLAAVVVPAVLVWGRVSVAADEPYAQVKARYVAAVDAECEKASRQSELHESEPAGPVGEVAELRRVAASMTTTVAEIEAIAPPAADVARVRAGFHTPARALAAGLRTLSGRAEAALRDGREREAMRVVEQSLAPDENEKAVRAFAVAYGLRTCAGE